MELDGQITIGGITYTSPLLTGKVTEFFYDGASLSYNFVFRIAVTGGSMASRYLNTPSLDNDLWMMLNLEGVTGTTDFQGTFASSFGGKIIGSIYSTPGKCFGTIGDLVWNDLNGNGIQDAGEPGLNGVSVNLFDYQGNLLQTVVTSAGTTGSQLGYYQFSGVCAGTYTVQVDTTTLPKNANGQVGFVLTTPNIGNNPAADSQTNPTTVTLSTTDTIDDKVDFGFVTSQGPIAWATPATITYGTALNATQLNATTNVVGTFVYTPSFGTVLAAGLQTLSVTFLPTNTAIYNTVTTTTSLMVNKATPTITWATPAGITYGTVLSATQLDATASVSGTFAYTPAAGTELAVGSLTLSVTFTPTDTTNYNTATGSVTLPDPPAASPTFSLAAGSYTSSQSVTISDSTSGATIYYTTNGTTPTTSSNVYSGPITVNSSETLEAIATATGYSQSAVGSAAFTITPPAATPTFSSAAGIYTSSQSVSILDTTSGATIYYTTDGTTPTTASVAYSGPITVSSTETINAIATAAGYSQSAVATAAYTITPPTGTPILQLRMNTTPATVTLSNPVNLDWIVWGADGSTTAATRMTNSNLISDMTPLNGASISANSNGPIGYNWTGGTPIATGNAVEAEMTTTGAGSGFQITAPADTTVKTLLLYVYINANAQLNASISDGSSPTVSHSSVTAQDAGYEIYSIDYRALSVGQTLTVQLTSADSNASIGLQAAVLQPHLPQVAILSPVAGQAFTASGIPVVVNSTQFDTSIASVQLILNGTPGVTMTTAPYETTLNPPPGHYVLQAQATDTAGMVSLSAPITFDVIGTGGSLSDSLNHLSANETVDLTTEGTEDWTSFSPASYGGTLISRKAGVLPLVSQYTIVSVATPSYNQSWYGLGPFAWEDGTPDPIEYSTQPETYIMGSHGTEVQLTAVADTNPRTLRLYLLGCNCNAQMSAFLSDGSAQPILDNSLI
jgi:hypothetical protein